ncbi:CD209 antigen-like protein B isoform X3 [Apodemus sylvaticus]|uniref:CD209 antigen-like protein B isoform X3 n=1 Tax=Apodemus sylvaticus TaxID=10129 RepID=UPI002244D59A|nr:CD209 antigen-like protein B isoform X3 [Apodemus sylvaticus]
MTMSDFTGAKMQPFNSMEDDELKVSDSRYSIKSSRLRANSGIKSLAGCLGHSQAPLVLQLFSFLFLTGLLLMVLFQVSKTSNTQGQEEPKEEKILQELTQLTDALLSRIPVSQGQNESMQEKITDQLMQLKAELLSRIPILQRQNESMQKISDQLTQLKAELLSKIPTSDEIQWEQKKQEKMYQDLSQMKSEVDSLCRLCPWDWTFFNGNCYFFSKSQRDWHSSITACQDMEAQLVIIKSHEEQSFLQQTSKKNGYTWMGLSDLNKEGEWYWLDGSPLSDRNAAVLYNCEWFLQP